MTIPTLPDPLDPQEYCPSFFADCPDVPPSLPDPFCPDCWESPNSVQGLEIPTLLSTNLTQEQSRGHVVELSTLPQELQDAFRAAVLEEFQEDFTEQTEEWPPTPEFDVLKETLNASLEPMVNGATGKVILYQES